MKMNKKGFTLIELLAVIVVLAIIALIATPIVMNTINNAKEGANARSVEGYMKAYEAAYYEEMLKNNGDEPETVTPEYGGAVVSCEGISKDPTNNAFTATKCTVDNMDFSYNNGKATIIKG